MKYTHLFIFLSFLIVSCNPSKEAMQENTMKEVTSPSGENASLPYLIKGADDYLYMSWVEKKDSGWTELNYAKLEGDEWSKPELIARGNDWFVNWADYPMMAVDTEGNMIAHYLAKSSGGTYSYDVNVVIKPKDSTTWSAPIIPHRDGTLTEHGFVSMIPNNDGTFLLVWLDGRNTGGGDHDSHGAGGAMTLRSAEINMQGDVSNEVELDNRVCDCCQTGATMTAKGPIVVYRDRSVDEVRDMAYVQLNGEQWSESSLVGIDDWKIEGCPVNGPRVTSKGNTVAVAWFSAAYGNAKVKVAFRDSETFGDPIIIDSSQPIGRVDVVLTDEENAIVSWLDGGDDTTIKYRSVSTSAVMTDPVIVSQISAERGSGFPQMELAGNELYFAWTEMGILNTIRIKKIDLGL